MEQSYLKSQLDYDADTGIFTWKAVSKFHKSRNGKEAGTRHHTGYLHISIDGKKYSAHRLAWLYVHGEFPEEFIDHINGVRDDNRIVNLRDVSHNVNCLNRKIQTSNTSGHPGVKNVSRYSKRKKAMITKFAADISVKGKRFYLGNFDTFEAAKSARVAAEKLYGHIVRTK